MAAKGQKLKNFVVQVRYPALTIAVSKRVAERYKSPADLKGMKIGVSAPGSSTHMVVNHLLSKGGADLERCLDHRRRHLGGGGRGDREGRNRRHHQLRSGDDQA